MDCNCGSSDAVRKEATCLIQGETKDDDIRLVYEGMECKRCGRIGCELLFANDEFAYRDTEARRRYQLAVDEKVFSMPVIITPELDHFDEIIITDDSDQLALF